MGEQYTKMELKALARFLRKVYPGVGESRRAVEPHGETRTTHKGETWNQQPQAVEIISEAYNLITGDRQNDYDHPLRPTTRGQPKSSVR
jgi:hypothetical protein